MTKREEIAEKVFCYEMKEKGILERPGALEKISRELGVPVEEVRRTLKEIVDYYVRRTGRPGTEFMRDCFGAVLLVEVDDVEACLQKQYQRSIH